MLVLDSVIEVAILKIIYLVYEESQINTYEYIKQTQAYIELRFVILW